MKEMAFDSATGVQRSLRIWDTEHSASSSRSVLLLIHGMAEHIHRYKRLIDALNCAGVGVCGFDLPGHGPETSRQDLGFFCERNGWSKILQDIHFVMQRLREMYPDRFVVLMGHSMGSFLVRAYCMRFSIPDALILSGTGYVPKPMALFGQGLAALQCVLGKGKKPSSLISKLTFTSYNKAFSPTKTPFDWLSRDEIEVQKYIADPFCGFALTASAYRDFFGGLSHLQDDVLFKLPKEMPVLLISGEQDPVGNMGKGVQRVYQQWLAAGMQNVTMKLYHNARHELFNETNREEVQTDLISWLQRQGIC